MKREAGEGKQGQRQATVFLSRDGPASGESIGSQACKSAVIVWAREVYTGGPSHAPWTRKVPVSLLLVPDPPSSVQRTYLLSEARRLQAFQPHGSTQGREAPFTLASLAGSKLDVDLRSQRRRMEALSTPERLCSRSASNSAPLSCAPLNSRDPISPAPARNVEMTSHLRISKENSALKSCLLRQARP